MKNLTWQNPRQLIVAQEVINKVKSMCCGIKVHKAEASPQATEKLLNGLAESNKRSIFAPININSNSVNL